MLIREHCKHLKHPLKHATPTHQYSCHVLASVTVGAEEFPRILLPPLTPARIHGSLAERPGQVPAQHLSRSVRGPM